MPRRLCVGLLPLDGIAGPLNGGAVVGVGVGVVRLGGFGHLLMFQGDRFGALAADGIQGAATALFWDGFSGCREKSNSSPDSSKVTSSDADGRRRARRCRTLLPPSCRTTWPKPRIRYYRSYWHFDALDILFGMTSTINSPECSLAKAKASENLPRPLKVGR